MALMPRSLVGSPLLLLTLVCGHAMAQEAGKWLDRMNRAVDELNYRGTFVHVIDGTAEILNIVHRSVAGTSGERILSQDGVPYPHIVVEMKVTGSNHPVGAKALTICYLRALRACVLPSHQVKEARKSQRKNGC